MLNVLILAGGIGKRLYPISTIEKPKQFLELVSDKTMLQITFERINKIVPLSNIFICTNINYTHFIQDQIPNFLEDNIIVEPQNKNTMAAITLSSFIINKRNPNSKILIVPSDHIIDNFLEFEQTVQLGIDFLNKERSKLIIFGIKPDCPSINYGYIEYNKDTNSSVNKIISFKEKPNLELANKYFKSKKYLWNSGMIMSDITTLIDEIKKYNIYMYDMFNRINDYDNELIVENYLKEIYNLVESISIDYSLLEKSNNIYAINSGLKWKDIGTFETLKTYCNL